MSKYTFLLPAYKSEYLEEAIRSIINQTYTDFTLVISDDCSPFDLKSIVGRFDDERIIYRRNGKNIGGYDLTKHWNMLVGQCTSPYLIMASDDDVYCSDFLKVIDEMVETYPTLDLFRGRAETINEVGEVVAEDDYFAPVESQISFFRNIYGENHSRGIGNYVFKTEKLKQNAGFIPLPFAWYSDTATTLLMAKKGVGNSIETIFKYRASGISITSCDDGEVAKGKLLATMEYDKWMSQYVLSNIEAKSAVDKTNLDRAIKRYRQDIYGKFLQYGKAYSVCTRAKLFKEMTGCPLFDRKEFFKVCCLVSMARFL